MTSISVYLASSPGTNPQLHDQVVALGNKIVQMNYNLIYGASSLGLMGLLASTVKNQGGRVIGVIHKHLVPVEKPPKNLDELHVVNSIQERKKMIYDLGDTFIAMPGGLGTLDEAFETWNLIRTKEMNKKIGFFNFQGYFDNLFRFITHAVDSGFIVKEHAQIPIASSNIDDLISRLTQA